MFSGEDDFKLYFFIYVLKSDPINAIKSLVLDLL